MIARRALALLLLVAFLGFASGANAAVCAAQCARAEHVHRLPMAGGHAHHHHHAAAPMTPSAANLAAPAHCVRSAPPSAAKRLLPQAPVVAVALAAAPALARSASAGPTASPDAAAPGPPLFATPLRL